ncbi:MAG TPA: hypothetical protein DEP84_19585 [Chloroflexi bacterium]|nr:hypothetical protein [Chloroflexota bacterium]
MKQTPRPALSVLLLFVVVVLSLASILPLAATAAPGRTHGEDLPPTDTPTPTPDPCTTLPQLEAEDGVITPPMEIVADASASGGQYVRVPISATSGTGAVRLSFSVPVTRWYSFDARTWAPDQTSNSLRVQVDGGPMFNWGLIPSSGWFTQQVRQEFDGVYRVYLHLGLHTITFYDGEKDTRLDWVQPQCSLSPSPSPSPTPTRTPTMTATATATETPTPTDTAIPTVVASETPTATMTPTATVTETATETPTATVTSTAVATEMPKLYIPILLKDFAISN